MVWTLIITTSIKYVNIAMRIDNDGEGGILALMSLLGIGQVRAAAHLASASSVRRSSMATAPSRRRFPCCPRWKASRIVCLVFQPYVLPIRS